MPEIRTAVRVVFYGNGLRPIERYIEDVPAVGHFVVMGDAEYCVSRIVWCEDAESQRCMFPRIELQEFMQHPDVSIPAYGLIR